nr:MAG TPA: hypothetical protein [Caudoviricetes sp.]
MKSATLKGISSTILSLNNSAPISANLSELA